MPKYKYFLLFFSGIAVLLLWCYFPVSFDNNDDQAMYAISSGMFSGISSPNLILTNNGIGKLLNNLFFFSKKINWYTLYLQIAQILSFLTVCYVFIKNKNSNIMIAILLVFFILLGFFSLCVVKLQFTTAALFCCFAALFCLQNELPQLQKIILVLFFISSSMLIRKDVFYVFIIFSIPIFITKMKKRNFILHDISVVLFSILLFCFTTYFNNNNKAYKVQQTYNNVNALDIIAAKPINIDNKLLRNNNFTADDITLMQSWFWADEAYLTGDKVEMLARSLKSNRNLTEIKFELRKFISEERYVLFMYAFSIVILLFFTRKLSSLLILNLLVFISFLMYLIITSRIPHRVTFPVITYLVLVNVYIFISGSISNKIKTIVLFLFFILSSYKFYCTSKLINIQKKNHQIFTNCQNEINAHPEILFIAIDDFPLQYMNAWQTPENGFPAHNLILSGWYACSPDYQVLLKLHQIKDLTSGLKNKENVLFLTNAQKLQTAYINVMKQRYNINCHFENVQEDFKQLHPKRLVIDY